MGGLRTTIAIMVLATVASSLAACGVAGIAAPTPAACGGIPAEFGGCSGSRPVYSGTTCDDVATEWAHAVDRLVVETFAEPPVAGEKQRSARISDAIILASITAGMHLDERGLLGTCSSDGFVTVAEPLFGEELRAGIGAALYDDLPSATWDQFVFEIRRGIKIIDVAPSATT